MHNMKEIHLFTQLPQALLPLLFAKIKWRKRGDTLDQEKKGRGEQKKTKQWHT